MNRTLILPQNLIDKLETAFLDSNTKKKWESIGVNSVSQMLDHMIMELNKKNIKLSITSRRIEKNDEIKEKLKNGGNTSKFAGYFENEKGFVDALFFYIDPNASSANDFISRYVMPVILGIYKNCEDRVRHNRINFMPVYIVSFCSTSRPGNGSVKKNIVLAETIGFEYLDIFNNTYHDVINKIDSNGNPITSIMTLEDLDDFLKDAGGNKYFDIDIVNKTIVIKSDILAKSKNQSAELYRYALRVIPAVYLAGKKNYTIDVTSLSKNSAEYGKVLYRFLSKF